MQNSNAKSKDDWGLFVPIDLETSASKQKNKKYSRHPIIFINEKDKLRYYLRYQRYNLIQSVILLKSPLLNGSCNILIKKREVEKTERPPIKKNLAILTSLISSGVFIFVFALNYSSRKLF